MKVKSIKSSAIALVAMFGLAQCAADANPYKNPAICSADDMIGTMTLDRKNAYSKIRGCLDAGANPNAIGSEGFSLLGWVARYNDAPLTMLLLGSGADPNLRDARGLTPLYSTIAGCNTDAGNLLIDAGGSLRVLSEDNQTAAIDALGATCRHGTPEEQAFGKRLLDVS